MKTSLSWTPRVDCFLGIWHKKESQQYYYENSLRGISHAALVGASAIDIDCQITKDGHIVATHWPEPIHMGGFHDPLGKIHRRAKIRDLTLAEVQRLRTPEGLYICTAVEVLQYAAKRGIVPCFEVKDDPRFEKPEAYRELVSNAILLDHPIVIMTLPHLAGRNRGYRRLQAARDAGVSERMVLTGYKAVQRGAVPLWAWPDVTMVKGPYGRWGRPKSVKWLKPRSVWGQEVGNQDAARVVKKGRAKYRRATNH